MTERLLGRNMFDAVESEIRLESISNGITTILHTLHDILLSEYNYILQVCMILV